MVEKTEIANEWGKWKLLESHLKARDVEHTIIKASLCTLLDKY